MYYDILNVGHVVAATIWLGAGFVLTLLTIGAQRARDPSRVAAYQRDIGWLAPRLFIPASLATLIFGVLLVAEGFWEFDELWIVLALVGWAISFLLGFFYFKPMGAKIAAAAEAHGPDSPEVAGLMHRLDPVDHFQLTVLFLVLADMVLKPTGDDGAILVGGAVILGAVIGWSLMSFRRDPNATPAT